MKKIILLLTVLSFFSCKKIDIQPVMIVEEFIIGEWVQSGENWQYIIDEEYIYREDFHGYTPTHQLNKEPYVIVNDTLVLELIMSEMKPGQIWYRSLIHILWDESNPCKMTWNYILEIDGQETSTIINLYKK